MRNLVHIPIDSSQSGSKSSDRKKARELRARLERERVKSEFIRLSTWLLLGLSLMLALKLLLISP